MRHLHERFVAMRESLDAVGAQLLDAQAEWGGGDRARLASEQVSDFIERHVNYFPALEAEAERVRQDGRIEDADLFGQLSRYLARTHDVTVRIRTVEEMGGAVRRYDPERTRAASVGNPSPRLSQLSARGAGRAARLRGHARSAHARSAARVRFGALARTRRAGELLRRRRAHALQRSSCNRRSASDTTSNCSAIAFASDGSRRVTD